VTIRLAITYSPPSRRFTR